METPKLGVASILRLNIIHRKTRVLGAGRTQSDCIRSAPHTDVFHIIKYKWMPRRVMEFPWISEVPSKIIDNKIFEIIASTQNFSRSKLAFCGS